MYSFIITRARLHTITTVTACGMNAVRSDGRVVITVGVIPNRIARLHKHKQTDSTYVSKLAFQSGKYVKRAMLHELEREDVEFNAVLTSRQMVNILVGRRNRGGQVDLLA